jgi:BMFP domain-containing protein YqiC
VPLRTRLQSLDLRVGELRASLAALAPAASTSQSGASASQAAVAAASYVDLTPSKAQRLISAREKQVDMLETRLAQLGEGADGDVGAKDAAPQEGCRREEKEKDGEVRVDLEQLDAAQRALRVLPP